MGAGGSGREAVIALPNNLTASLERFTAHERLSQLFVIEAFVLCDDEGVDFFPALGGDVTITVNDDGSPVRYFHGLLYEAESLGQTPAGFRHRLVLKPWTYQLSRNRNFKIFQKMNALDIVKAVIEANNGRADYSVSTTPKVREYCVQYREDDFSFISRLMEEEGIFYFFKHEEDSHTMVVCDAPTPPVSLSLPFRPVGDSGRAALASLSTWSERISTTAEASANLANFDFTRPQSPQTKQTAKTSTTAGDTAVVFDFPAPSYQSPDDGLDRAGRIIAAASSEQRLYLAEGDAPGLACGAVLTLTDHPVDRFGADYLITALIYSNDSQVYRSGGDAGGQSRVVIEATPKATPWRPPLATPRPVVRGPETAIVVGPTKDDIYTDEYGRVKVAFHWDQSITGTERSTASPDPTCWIRVSHGSAGATFGVVILPRVGQEVIVDFLDGDPDRPIVTGRVYNQSNMPPYTLQDNKTRSVWRTRTIGTTGQSYDEAENPPGSGPGSNEIRMEDKSANEEIYLHAQRVMTTWVRLDDDHKVGRDQTRRVGRNRTTNIKKNETVTVETGDVSYTVQQGKRTETVQSDDALTVQQGDKTVTVSTGNFDTTVSTGNRSVTVSTGNDSKTVSTGNHSTAISLGNYSVKCDAGSVTIEAMQQIELKVGANSVVIDQSGVTVKGMMIKQQATVQWSAQGAMTQLEADAMTTVKGAIVMIN